MSDPIDKALDEYLGGNSQVSRRYRELDDAAVPPHLDRLVLARARAAVAGQQESYSDEHSDGRTDELERLRRRRRRLMRWSVPAGLAASAVLVISIVMQSGVRHEAVSLPQRPVQAPAAAQEHSDALGERQEEAVVLTQPSAPPPMPMIAVPDTPSAAPSPAEMEKNESDAKRLRQREQKAPLAVTVPDLSNEPVPASPTAAPVAPVSMRANAPPPPAVQVPREIQRSASNRAINSTAIRQTTATQSTAESRDDSLRAPEPWLEDIRQLRKAGKGQEADREWQRFREVYPDYAVGKTDAARKEGDDR